ncbi:MAG TPA: hypothetical protein PLB02_04835 [Thermoanaerobaculia bacterium]|nr:hypothetical protein [Thermoanaerobaculia bacterium]HQR66698.1 hypothetical protein [Thermoanaerobaculia bacterium]
MERPYQRVASIWVPPGLSLSYARVDAPGDEPEPEAGTLDVAVLDMHHGYPNLGHHSIVETVLNIAHQERREREGSVPGVRVISYDVRGRGAVPRPPASRFALVVGTGGPGALDPRQNDGRSAGSQGILEDPSWEAPLFRFFDDVLATPETALFAICHSFGVLVRWAGVAEAFLRSELKGGKSQGVVGNVLTTEARDHPFFSGFWNDNGGPEIRVLDSRLYDLIPTGRPGTHYLAFEAPGPTGLTDAVTMCEFARHGDGVLPRVWGVNCHPEIGDKGLQRERLDRMAERGEVTEEWVRERRVALDAWDESAHHEHSLQRTSAWTFEMPIRAHLGRALDERK